MKRASFLRRIAAIAGLAPVAPAVLAEKPQVAEKADTKLDYGFSVAGLNAKQAQAAIWWNDNETEDILFRGEEAAGKTHLAYFLLFQDANKHPDVNLFLAGPSMESLKTEYKKMRDTMKKVHGLKTKYDTVNDIIFFENGSRLYLIDCPYREKDPKFYRFGSIQMTRGIIYNADMIRPEAVSALQATVGRWKNKESGMKGKVLMTSRSLNSTLMRYMGPAQSRTRKWIRV